MPCREATFVPINQICIQEMKEQKFMVYETPQVELVEVFVEQGFAGSSGEGSTTSFGESEGAW